jgi:predicted nucleic acid-binding Zn ribbon protein
MSGEMPERYFYNRRSVARIGQILRDVIPKRGGSNSTYNRVRGVWRDVVGEDVCKYADVKGLRNGVLYVNAESTSLIHHLTNFEKHAIIARINEIMGMKCIEDIRFKAGMLDGSKGK